jgi:hypothetical protein
MSVLGIAPQPNPKPGFSCDFWTGVVARFYIYISRYIFRVGNLGLVLGHLNSDLGLKSFRYVGDLQTTPHHA